MGESANQGSSGIKAALGAVAGGAIIAMIALVRPDKATLQAILLILLGALVLIVLLLLVYKLILKLLAARKGKPFSESVTQAAGSTPNSISAVASRAKLDDLRRNFEAGVVKFRAAGKDLYQVPWYVLIGEPGSGKTEAIRHSGIPFPPGLQDQLQGAGGTVNMNWWFTNDAVILDTAGRYLFDEVQPGASSEWTEFLRLLARNRPQCPINGLLLVIPANSLILDTADQIESKAGKIAQQLDRIQRTLDLRFPVFVVVTKCDLINGFREFFDGFNQQSQQHQILGWSNPAPLDEPFNAELVDEHLKTVHARLMERRLGLLLDPVAREAADGKRTDEVDSLFSMPDSFVRIGPRLRQYLEMVFVAGEWSPKPLFLRGIYFTSSMREGQALDAELAELLGVPVDSLTEERMWDKDRAFFLKDLFVKKVFPEQGLVTRAVNAGKVERNRKITLLTGGFVSAMALLGFTFFGAQQLKQSVTGQAAAWKKYQGVVDKDTFVIVSPTKEPTTFKSQFDVQPPGQTEDPAESIGQIQTSLLELEQKEIAVPIVLKPAAGIIDRSVKSADIDANRHLAYQRIYERSVVIPLADAVDKKLAAETSTKWPDSATSALIEMIHLRSDQTPNISALFAYAVSTESATKYKDYLGKLDTGFKYAQPTNGAWPIPVNIVDDSLDTGVATFIAHWTASIKDLNEEYKKLAVPGGEPGALQIAQANLATVCESFANKPAKSLDEYNQNVQSWNAAWAKYESAYQAVRKSVNKFGPAGTVSLADQYRAAHKAKTAEVNTAYTLLLSSFPPPPAATAAPPGAPSVAQLAKLRGDLATVSAQLGSTINDDVIRELGKYDKSLLVPVPGASPDAPTQYLFELVHQAYDATNTQLLPPPDATAAPAPADAQKVADVKNAARKDVDARIGLLPNKADSDVATRLVVTRNCDALFDTLILPKARLDDLNARLPDNVDTVEELVSTRAADKRSATPRKFAVPFTTLDFKESPISSKFNPGAALEVLTTQQALLREIADECAKTLKARQGYDVPYTLNGEILNSRRGNRQRDMDVYIDSYAETYENLLTKAANPVLKGGATWAALQGQILPDNPSTAIMDDLKEVGKLVSGALKQLPAGAGDNEKVKGAIEKANLGLEEIKNNDDFANKMSNWRELGKDANAARNTLIKLTAKDFSHDYLEPVEDPARSNYVKLYLNRLTLQMLHLLATAPNQGAANALAKLQQPDFQKFPLHLKAADFIFPVRLPGNAAPGLDELRADVDGLVFPAASAAGVANQQKKGDKDVIADGGRIIEGKERDKVNNELDTLVDGGMNAAGWETLKKLKALLDVIPRNGEAPLQCTVSITPDPTQAALLQNKLPMKNQFRVIELVANKKVTGQPAFLLNNPGVLGPVTTPSDTVQFYIFDTNNGFNAKTPKANVVPWNSDPQRAKQPDDRDPWQCLRFLAGNAQKSLTDPKSWDVELDQEVKGVHYALWVRFQFNKELPDLKNWPQ